MGGNGKRGGGDRVLESRHLVALFLGVVILCGVFFTLGYVMGHTQYDVAVHAADAPPLRPDVSPKPKAKSTEAEKTPAPAAGEWDFYGKKDDNNPQPGPKAESTSPLNEPNANRPTPKNVAATESLPPNVRPPKMQKSAIVLQLAALRRQSDALALADELQQKRFPSFVLTPTADNFYRVQVGPYSTEAEAEAVKRQLDRHGFKAIIKR
jgi:cell division septation protein DedD